MLLNFWYARGAVLYLPGHVSPFTHPHGAFFAWSLMIHFGEGSRLLFASTYHVGMLLNFLSWRYTLVCSLCFFACELMIHFGECSLCLFASTHHVVCSRCFFILAWACFTLVSSRCLFFYWTHHVGMLTALFCTCLGMFHLLHTLTVPFCRGTDDSLW
jgi:hypothetical protein